MGVYIAGVRRRARGAFGAGILAAAIMVGCGGRTDLPPEDGSTGSAIASASGSANATSGVASGNTTDTVAATSGTTSIGESGTVAATSGSFIGASGTVTSTSGTVFVGSS